MLPDLRFAIGAVLAGALLIVTAFGLAATARFAHHQSAAPFEGSRPISYAEAADAPLAPPVAAVDVAPAAEATRSVAADAPVRGNVDAMIPRAEAEAGSDAAPTEASPSEPDERVAALPPGAEEKVDSPPAATLPATAGTPVAKAKKTKRKRITKKRKRYRTYLWGYHIERLFRSNARARAPTVD
jgi:hypothetical protein